MNIDRSEKFNSYSHFSGAIIAIFCTGLLLILSSKSIGLFISSVIYGSTVTFLFFCSFLYHGLSKENNENSFWRKLDHIAIFFMIAGTYTPFIYIYTEGIMLWVFLGVQWGLVIIGSSFKLFFMSAPRWIGTGFYLAEGWTALLFAGRILDTVPHLVIIGLVIGAFMFTSGAIIYLIKKPNPKPEIFGSHGVFHIFVLIGALTHFFTVVLAIVG